MKRSKPDRAHPVMVALVVILWAFIGIILLFMESAKKSGVKPPCALVPAFVVAT